MQKKYFCRLLENVGEDYLNIGEIIWNAGEMWGNLSVGFFGIWGKLFEMCWEITGNSREIMGNDGK